MSAVVLATAGYDHKIRFWEASREKCTRVIKYPDSQVNMLAITNDKQHIAAVGNPHAKIFDVHRGEGLPVRSYDAHQGNVTSVGFQCDAKWMYTGSDDKTIKIWDLRAPRWQRQYVCAAGVTSVALHPNQTELISGDLAGSVRVWDLQANACAQEMSPNDYDYPTQPGDSSSSGGGAGGLADPSSSSTSSPVKSSDQAHATSGGSFFAMPSASATPGAGASFVPRHGGDAAAAAVRSLSLASDGSLLVAANHAGRLFGWVPLRALASPANGGPGGDTTGGDATAPGAAAGSSGNKGFIRRFACDSGHAGHILKVVISPDVGRFVTTSSDKTVRVWSLNKFREMLYQQRQEAAAAAAAAAGKSGEGNPPAGTVPLPPPPPSTHATPTMPPLAPGTAPFALEKSLAQHQRWVWDACFSADSAYLVTASSDFTAKLWDVNSGDVIRLYASPMAVTCVALNDASN